MSGAIEVDLRDLVSRDDHDLQRWQSLWVALVDHPWSTLALVPVSRETLALDVVSGLLRAARGMHESASVLGNPAAALSAPLRRLSSTGPPLLFPAAALIARKADAVALVVALQEDTVEQVRRVRDMIGSSRILGCVAVTRSSRKGLTHVIGDQRGNGNVQPSNGTGAVARGFGATAAFP